MSDPELEDIVKLLKELQQEPPGPIVKPPSAPAGFAQPMVLLGSLMPTEVELRHCSSSDPDQRIRTVESKLRTKFESKWSMKAKQAQVADIFIIGQYGDNAMKHEAAVKAHINEVKRSGYMNPWEKAVTPTFHGTKRYCNVGENNSLLKPCYHRSCLLCSIMRFSFSMSYVGLSSGHRFGLGIYSSTDPFKASTYVHNIGPNLHRHAILLCSTVTGHVEKLRYDQPNKPGPSNTYDSVLADDTAPGIDYPETVIFQEDALMPHALITYDFRPHPKPQAGLTLSDGGIYTVTNKMFGKAMDVDPSDDRIVGSSPSNSVSQQWIFRSQATGGWVIQSKGSRKYLGMIPSTSDHNRTLCYRVSYTDATVWEIQPAIGGTYRIAMYHKLGKCVDLSMKDGKSGADPAKIWIFDHLTNYENQRWVFNYIAQDASPGPSTSQPRGHTSPTQRPVNGGVYVITNDLYNTAIDLWEARSQIQNYRQNGRPNQHWVFQKAAGGGWHIHSEAKRNVYFGLANPASRQRKNTLVAAAAPGITWDVQEAMNGAVRIVPHDAPTTANLEVNMLQQGECQLWSHLQGGKHQRWYLRRTS